MVCGLRTDKVLDKGHHTLPTFGAGWDRDRGWWLSLIRELDTGGYLVRGKGRTAGFSLSARGRMVLFGKEKFLAARTKDHTESYRPRAVEEPAPVDRPGQEELLQRLKALRTRLARKRNVPPYVIFSDKTLRAIARYRPTDPAAFLRCPGVGDRKLEAYGGDFLATIREFCQTREEGGAP